nr:ATPase [Oculatellaceae cyanobacterium Prado106]
AIAYLQSNRINGRHTLADLIETLITDIQTHSLDRLTQYPQGDLMAFRSFELAAVVNRLRSLEIL